MPNIEIGSKVAHVNGGGFMEVIDIDELSETAKVIRINARGISETAFFKLLDLVHINK